MPYNDTAAWGIVPAWGYAAIVKSTIQSLPPGAVLWGFWPTADITVDLQLREAQPKGNWKEVSQHRQRLMTVYNVYTETHEVSIPPSAPGLPDELMQSLAWEATFRPTWQTGYLISQHVFCPNSESEGGVPVHPSGKDLPWTMEHADLSDAVLISLSASSKTARSFAYHVFRRPASSGPLGFLQVTQSPSLISNVSRALHAVVRTQEVDYGDLGHSANWMAELKPSRLVIVDFGSRFGTVDQLLDLIKSHPSLPSTNISIIQVGSEQKVPLVTISLSQVSH